MAETLATRAKFLAAFMLYLRSEADFAFQISGVDN